ncbi:MAG: redoxin domain-containing protein [Planctomycetota bacterium]|jgi:thiol-disulfide isomerase/thioredoxin
MTRIAFIVLVLSSLAVADRPKIRGYEGEVKEIIDRTVKVYKGLDTYQDRVAMEFDVEAKDEDSPWLSMMADRGKSTMKLRFKRPHRFTIQGDMLPITIYCDGKQIWQYSESEEQYIESPVPHPLSTTSLKDEISLLESMSHPVLEMLLDEDPVKTLQEDIEAFTGVKSEVQDGKPGYRLNVLFKPDKYPMLETLKGSVWIEKETGLYGQISVDMTEMMKEMMKNMPYMAFGDEDEEDDEEEGDKVGLTKYVMIMKFEDIKLNEELPDDIFVFKPGSEDEKVDEFDFMGGYDEGYSAQLELINKPAPDFKGEDLEGKKLALSDFKGKVLLLDFWATWCGPCVMAMPHIQKVADKFKGKDVVVLGVNSDNIELKKQVGKLLDKRKITYRQLMDPDSKWSKEYKVRGIPCLVLIDKKGIVQDVSTGFSSGEVDELAEKIEKLLKGENLRSEEELEELRKEIAAAKEEEEDEDDEDDSSEAASLDEVAPETLNRGKRQSMQASAWHSQEMDIDGDGLNETIMPSWQNRLYVIRGDGSDVDSIRLKGMSRRSSISDVHLIRGKGENSWFVASQRHSIFGTRSSMVVSLHDSKGEMVWDHKFAVPKDHSGEAHVDSGDLNGNGLTEFVVVFKLIKIKQTGKTRWLHGKTNSYLMIYDDQGELLACRRLKKDMGWLKVIPASSRGPGKILVLEANSRLVTYGFDDTLKTSTAPTTGNSP